jgi:hypothetical protein
MIAENTASVDHFLCVQYSHAANHPTLLDLSDRGTKHHREARDQAGFVTRTTTHSLLLYQKCCLDELKARLFPISHRAVSYYNLTAPECGVS